MALLHPLEVAWGLLWACDSCLLIRPFNQMPFVGLAEPSGTASEDSGRFGEPFGFMLDYFESFGIEMGMHYNQLRTTRNHSSITRIHC